MTHKVFQVTNKETGEVFYCLNVHSIVQITNFQSHQFRFAPFKSKWDIEEIDGSELKYGQIYLSKHVW